MILTFPEVCDIVLGAKGVAYGLLQQVEELEQFDGSRQQVGFEPAHRRLSSFRVFLSNSKKCADITHADLLTAITKAFALIGWPVPEVLAAQPTIAPQADSLIGRSTLKVVAAACCRCSSEKARQWTNGDLVHIRLGRALAPVQLLICDRCATAANKAK